MSNELPKEWEDWIDMWDVAAPKDAIRDFLHKLHAERKEMLRQCYAATSENNILRGLIAKLPQSSCVYCGLEDMSRCAAGFPGCPKADDIMVGGDEEMKQLLLKNKELQRPHDALAETVVELRGTNAEIKARNEQLERIYEASNIRESEYVQERICLKLENAYMLSQLTVIAEAVKDPRIGEDPEYFTDVASKVIELRGRVAELEAVIDVKIKDIQNALGMLTKEREKVESLQAENAGLLGRLEL